MQKKNTQKSRVTATRFIKIKYVSAYIHAMVVAFLTIVIVMLTLEHYPQHFHTKNSLNIVEFFFSNKTKKKCKKSYKVVCLALHEFNRCT